MTKHDLESGTVDQIQIGDPIPPGPAAFLFETALANATGALGHQRPFQSLLGPKA